MSKLMEDFDGDERHAIQGRAFNGEEMQEGAEKNFPLPRHQVES
ncbi:MAG: hypothetical protein ACREXS_11050 [Gammaproteobacteria bacterium]